MRDSDGKTTRRLRELGAASLCGAILICAMAAPATEGAEAMNPSNKGVITLGGGCFWCIEAIVEELKGVESAVSGYSGGTVPNPSYEDVCTGRTGHAEAVQVTFDPKVISLKDLLQVFFTLHDPTTLNRQGADVGTQYRSVVFYRNEEQKAVTVQVIEEFDAAKVWNGKIVTEVVPFKAFYPAEKHHQEYYAQNANQGYCRVVIAPKIAKLRKQFLDKLKKQ
jgi:peptide-methionine (S)-S-oxide reductase